MKNFREDIVREYIECDCGTKGHMAVVEYDVEMGLCLHYQHRNWQGFWKRVWTAFKFVFQLGWEHDMGWDCTIMNRDHAAQLQRMLDLAKEKGYGTMWDGRAATDSEPPLPPSV